MKLKDEKISVYAVLKNSTVVEFSYIKPIDGDFVRITEEEHLELTKILQKDKEIVCFDGSLELVEFNYENALVKFMDGSYSEITDYDFRLEGVLYKKINHADQEYLDYLSDLEAEKIQKNMQYNDSILQEILVSTDFATNSPEVSDKTKQETIIYKNKVRRFKSDLSILKSTLEIDYKKNTDGSFATTDLGYKIIIGYKFGDNYLEVAPKIEFII